jgi:hypothetical protein
VLWHSSTKGAETVEAGPGQIGARGAPAPNAGKIVQVRWVKRYAEAANQVCVGEIVRETPEYLVMKGLVLSYHKGEAQAQRDEERVRWIPWSQIAVVCELPSDLKWRQAEFFLDELGRVKWR